MDIQIADTTIEFRSTHTREAVGDPNQIPPTGPLRAVIRM